jgi:transposase
MMSEGMAAAVAGLLEILLPRLAEFCVPKSVCKFLREEVAFQTTEFQCQQIGCVGDIAECQDNVLISINALARAFNWSGSRAKSALEHPRDPAGSRGKHTALDSDHEQQILEWIRQNAERSTPLTKKEIKDYCISQLQVPITRGRVNSFVLRYADDIIQTKSTPMKSRVSEYRACFSREPFTT